MLAPLKERTRSSFQVADICAGKSPPSRGDTDRPGRACSSAAGAPRDSVSVEVRGYDLEAARNWPAGRSGGQAVGGVTDTRISRDEGARSRCPARRVRAADLGSGDPVGEALETLVGTLAGSYARGKEFPIRCGCAWERRNLTTC